MGRPPSGIGRTTVVCLALVVLCLTVATRTWQAAETNSTTQATATVERIVLAQQGQRADIPLVTASFSHNDTRFEVQFEREGQTLATGDRVGVFFEPDNPADAKPEWAIQAERGNQRFLATCVAIAAVIAAALAVADRRHRLGRPVAVSYHGQPLTS